MQFVWLKWDINSKTRNDADDHIESYLQDLASKYTTNSVSNHVTEMVRRALKNENLT